MDIKGVVFDMDGVLVDNMPIHIEAFAVFCERYGGHDNWEEVINSSVGMGNDEILQKMMPQDVIAKYGTAELGRIKEAIYREIYAGRIQPVAGLVELLEEFKSRGIKCAVGSSGCKENVEFVLRECGIGDYFDALIYSDLVTRCKPDPEIYQLAIQKLGLEASEVLIFEDATSGIKAAKAAGAGKIIALSTTLTPEVLATEGGIDRIVADFSEVAGGRY
ncbi:MAG: HAD family phosphatase [Rikenellaceae bacterium]